MLNDESADANKLADDIPDELVNGVSTKAGIIIERFRLGWVVIDGVDSVFQQLFIRQLE